MVRYRRNYIPGGTYFFTVCLMDRRSFLLTDHIALFKTAFDTVQNKKPFEIEAIVILPDHLHAIFKLPEYDSDYASRWKAIKSLFTRGLIKSGVEIARNSKGEYALWQRRYWEHTIANDEGFRRHVDYIHYNPVKHVLVSRVRDWPRSSFHRYVKEGLLPLDWAYEESNDERLAMENRPGFRFASSRLRVLNVFKYYIDWRSKLVGRPVGALSDGRIIRA